MSKDASPVKGASPGKRMDVAQSVVFSMRTLEAVAARQPVSLVDLARHLNAPKTTVLRSLRALLVAGYVYQDPDHPRWSLTLRCLRLAEAANSALGLVEAAMPAMKELSAATEETVFLGALERDTIVVVAKVDGRKAVRAYSERGTLLPLHASSSGKAVLAQMDDDVVKDLVGGRLEQLTETTITEFDQLRAELATTRRQGYAVNRGEREADVVGVAAAVRDASGSPIAAITVALPRQHADDALIDSYGERCIEAAQAVSARLGWSGV